MIRRNYRFVLDDLRNPKLGVHPYKIRKRLRGHLLHNLPSMNPNGDLAGSEFPCSLFVQETGNNKGKNLALSWRK